MNTEEIANNIAFELMYENEEDKKVHDDSIEKDCYLAVADLKAEIKDEVCKILQKKGYEISW